MNFYASLIIENGSFLAIFLISIAAAYACNKRAKDVPGASLMMLGFLLYSVYGLLAISGPGFTGSFFRDFAKVGVLESASLIYFLGCASRVGMVLILAGMYAVAKNRRIAKL
ncbi:MAG: hypothetical protein C4520_19485 [Candidatus Abyssobacteria bacterium SURF_5]|uniref:Uncharacterized protein n=1 Tax=Abyssobacteria bacterium (strain SURF_5) TaxID=2093360 RepID=A0A3A4NLZ0_ABYX5|nr:MAG: hypothetical protein C4520_19485 [Candidatus Abyssubacteria bacterium SURF_5]